MAAVVIFDQQLMASTTLHSLTGGSHERTVKWAENASKENRKQEQTHEYVQIFFSFSTTGAGALHKKKKILGSDLV